jgi:hypothetical protein
LAILVLVDLAVHPNTTVCASAFSEIMYVGLQAKIYVIFQTLCHAQSLAATNRVTEQLNWLTVESFFMSCSISWMASLIDSLYLLDLIVLVIN